MQHDQFLKKLHFDLLTPMIGLSGLRANYLLSCCFICDSILFDMQHDHVPKKLNLVILTKPPNVRGIGGGGVWRSL